MKKLFVLFLSLTILAACSKDDDDNTVEEKDPIVGTWVLVGVNPSTVIDVDGCEQQSTITLNENNTGEGSFYFTQANCEEQATSGNWQNNGNSSYTISVPIVGNITGTANFSGEDEFTFTTNIGVMTFERQQ